MKRLASNIGLVLTLGLLLTGCGKKAQPVTGGSGVVPQYSGDSFSPQISSLKNQMFGKRMDVGIQLMGSGLPSRLRKIGCTNSSTASTSGSWLGGLLNFSFGGINTCVYSIIGQDIQFTSADQDQAVMVANGVLTKADILEKTFNPSPSMLVKGCAGTISPMISAATRNGNNGSQLMDFIFREDCPNNQPYLLHYITTEADINKPLAQHPLSTSVYRTTQNLNNQNSQVTPVKHEYHQLF